MLQPMKFHNASPIEMAVFLLIPAKTMPLTRKHNGLFLKRIMVGSLKLFLSPEVGMFIYAVHSHLMNLNLVYTKNMDTKPFNTKVVWQVADTTSEL